MLWNYISENYSPGEPIVASDIDIGLSEVNKRRQFKLLTDCGKLSRFENGIYYTLTVCSGKEFGAVADKTS